MRVIKRWTLRSSELLINLLDLNADFFRAFHVRHRAQISLQEYDVTWCLFSQINLFNCKWWGWWHLELPVPLAVRSCRASSNTMPGISAKIVMATSFIKRDGDKFHSRESGVLARRADSISDMKLFHEIIMLVSRKRCQALSQLWRGHKYSFQPKVQLCQNF